MPGKAVFWYRLHVEVRPPGQEPFDADFKQYVEWRLGPGSEVAVIFDPNDHSKICFDEQAPPEVSMPRVGRVLGAVAPAGSDARSDSVSGGDVLAAMGNAAAAGDRDELHRLKAQFAGQLVDKRGSVVQGAAESASGSGTADEVNSLQTLANLHASGALTDAEFAAEKAKILGQG